MMKTLNKISIILMIVGIFACELPDNVDPKNPREVPTKSLVTNAQRYLGDYVSTMNYNVQINRFLVRYWTEVTYLDEVKYDFSDRSIPDNWWNVMYRNTLMDFEVAKNQVENTEFAEVDYPFRDNQLAIIDICQVYAWHLLVETFGNIPYTEALDPDNSTPAYDDAETIYKDLIDRLTEDISLLTEGEPSLGSADLFYEGDPGAWKKFAASLKFRMAMRLADYDPGYSQEQANDALDAGIIESPEDDAIFKFTTTSPNVHSIYDWFVNEGRSDVVPTESFVRRLEDLDDPRLDYLVDTTSGPAQPYAVQVDVYDNVAHLQEQFFAPDFEHVFIDYVEMEFLKAEAIERGGYDVSGTAEEHYNNAIEASIKYWGGTLGIETAILEDQANDYLSQPEVDYDQAEGDWRQKIGLQKWIALYNRGCESWSSWRILEYPEFEVTPEMGTKYDEVPVRYPYPFDEPRLNEANYNEAVSAMGGEDSPLVNLFWDVN